MIDERKHAKLKKMKAKTEVELKEVSKRCAEQDSTIKKACHRDKKDWLIKKGEEAQNAVDRGDSRTLYRIFNELTGVRNMLNIPTKDKNGKLLMSDEELNKRWIEHFRDVFNQSDPPQTYNFDDEREATGAVDELDVNTGDISVEGTETAIRSLRNKKSPDLDEIPAELLKAGGRTMAEQLT
ncbi:hypothetical protein Y032_0022g535 [Ancylostoma ceylanicum]|uniref:Uncharacterized protein n=1 Tax=Ancylostoma ceylanicum TaxID=53326 RepID=A0A016UYJ2_9BILA|nr:hypothetical protein Y032_0022g535 [Ancylostoma ceylanicum]